MTQPVYQFTLTAIDGKPMPLVQYKGKKILFVNTASECGNTPQYDQLEDMSIEFKDKLVIIGLPCNDFGGQEPGTEADIVRFCQKNYGVTFPLTQKVGIKNNTHPLYQYLTKKELNGYADSEVEWNFQKYLVDENGLLIAVFPHHISPADEEILKHLN
jgi:glutathione peroxidase